MCIWRPVTPQPRRIFTLRQNLRTEKTNSLISFCSWWEICALQTGGFSGPPHSTLFRKAIILYRVPEFRYSRLNWVPPPPPSQASVSPPLVPKWGEPHSLVGEGVGGTQFNRQDRTLVLYIVESLYSFILCRWSWLPHHPPIPLSAYTIYSGVVFLLTTKTQVGALPVHQLEYSMLDFV